MCHLKMKIQMLFKTMLLVSSIATSLAYADPNIWVADQSGRLGIVDVETGSATIIINRGLIYVDIAFDSNGNLYGVDPSKLYSINKATGWGTVIGSLGISDLNSLAFSSNGTLYMLGQSSNNLYRIDTKTGQATVVFNTGHYGRGLAFLNGNLYYTDGYNLLLINPTDLKTTLIGLIGAYTSDLVLANNGVLYGIAGNSVYSINTSTGEGTLVTAYANGLGNALGATAATLYTGATDCLLNWAENNYSYLFSPAGSSSMFDSIYNYRYYPVTHNYLGISSDDDHVYIMGSDGKLQDKGSSSYWLPKANCQAPLSPQIECLFNWAEKKYPTLFAPTGNSTQFSTVYTYYRNYSATNTFLGVSPANNHVYYSAENGSMQDEGPLSNWLSLATCQ